MKKHVDSQDNAKNGTKTHVKSEADILKKGEVEGARKQERSPNFFTVEEI